jgi:hypothetical protein
MKKSSNFIRTEFPNLIRTLNVNHFFNFFHSFIFLINFYLDSVSLKKQDVEAIDLIVTSALASD